MNTMLKSMVCGGLLTLCAISVSHAAAPDAPAGGGAKAEKLIDFKKCEIETQKAPDYSIKSSKEKKSQPKDWLEVEFEFECEAPKDAKDLKFLDQLEFTYFVALATDDPKAKVRTLTAKVEYVNVPLKEKVHSVVYLSPATIYNITGAKMADKGKVLQWGVQVMYSGKEVGRLTSNQNKEWWKAPTAGTAEEGRLLPKHKTPFAPLWFDYYLEEKSEK